MKNQNITKNRCEIFRLILMMFVFIVATSCENYLEEVPQNKLNPTYFNDYRELLNYGYITDKRVMPFIEALGDDVGFDEDDKVAGYGNPIADAGDDYMSAYMYELTHEESMGSDIAFESFYESIYYANLVITEVDAASSDVLNDDMEDDKAYLKGEAYALRAYSYFHLINLYGQHYDPETASTDFGIPITLSTAAEDKAYPRSTVKEVYDLITSDLEESVRLMEANPVGTNSKYLFNLQSTSALQSRVALYTQQWDKVIEAANNVLDDNSAIFDLSTLTDTYNAENDSDFDLFRTGTDYLDISNDNMLFGSGATENIPLLSIWPLATTFAVSEELANSYEEGDVRRYYFIGTHERLLQDIFSVKLNLVKNRENTPLATSAFYYSEFQGFSRVIRTEEVLLNRAEAYAENGELELAINDLNTLRVKKFDPDYYTDLTVGSFSQETLIDYIYNERRKELCFEGQRWFDLKRTTRPEMFRTGYNGVEAHILKDDPRYVLQIPEDELQVNPSIEAAPR